MTNQDWTVEFTLGTETAIFGRVRLPEIADDEMGLFKLGPTTRYKPGNGNVGFKLRPTTRDKPGKAVVGHGRKERRNYQEEFEWLTTIRKSACSKGGKYDEREVRLSSVAPHKDLYGLLKPHEAGYYGGSIVEFADMAIATWAAVGGVAGIIQFLKMIKELKSFWESPVSIEVGLKDGTTFKLTGVKDVDRATAIIRKMEAASIADDGTGNEEEKP